MHTNVIFSVSIGSSLSRHYFASDCVRYIAPPNLIEKFNKQQCYSHPGSEYFFIKTALTHVKGTGSRNRKQTYYLYNLYCCPHVAIVFCTDSGGWGESTRKLLPKIHQYLCNRTTYECFVCFSSKLKSLSSK